MREHTIRGYLNVYLFRFVAAATLMIIASFFATRPIYDHDGSGYPKYKAAQTANQEISDKRVLGFEPDSLTALSTLALAFLTFVLAGVGLIQIIFLTKADKTARISADASKQSADLARTAIVASNRAWLRVSANISGDITSDENGVSTTVGVKIDNIGKEVAKNISINCCLMAFHYSPHPLDRFRSRCDEWRNETFSFANSLFPNESFPSQQNIPNWAMGVNIQADEMMKSPGKDASGNQVCLLFVGVCVTYETPSDPGGRHQTRKLYDLQRFPPFGAFSIGSYSVPVGHLFLRETMSNGTYVD